MDNRFEFPMVLFLRSRCLNDQLLNFRLVPQKIGFRQMFVHYQLRQYNLNHHHRHGHHLHYCRGKNLLRHTSPPHRHQHNRNWHIDLYLLDQRFRNYHYRRLRLQFVFLHHHHFPNFVLMYLLIILLQTFHFLLQNHKNHRHRQREVLQIDFLIMMIISLLLLQYV